MLEATVAGGTGGAALAGGVVVTGPGFAPPGGASGGDERGDAEDDREDAEKAVIPATEKCPTTLWAGRSRPAAVPKPQTAPCAPTTQYPAPPGAGIIPVTAPIAFFGTDPKLRASPKAFTFPVFVTTQ